MKIVVVGGVAAGASAAVRARRMDDKAEIVLLEKGPYVSFANCGLPYYVGGDIEDREDLLLVSPELFKNRFHVEVRLHHEAVAIDREAKTLRVAAEGKEYEETYDKLILAPGCRPVVPPIPGVELSGIHTVFTVPDADAVVALLRGGAQSAVVVGGGFIGLETAEGLAKRGVKTTVVEMQEQLMTIFDPEFSLPMEAHLRDAGIDVRLQTSVQEFRGGEGHVREVVLSTGETLEADLVIMAAGLRPQTELAAAAHLRIGETGGIVVDDCMRTSDPDIYAAGDAVESWQRVSGRPIRVSLATNANRQGRIAGDNAAGGTLRYHGTLATSIIRVCDVTAARTGLTAREAEAAGYAQYSIYAPEPAHAGYYPDAGWMILKLTAEKETGRILGAQAIGDQGVDKRIDVMAAAICGGLKVTDLEDLDLAYAPPYSSAKGPEIMAGMIASNMLRGDEKMLLPAELDAFLAQPDTALIDIREQGEWDAGYIPGARHIPLGALRADPEQLEKGKRYVIYCGVGKRAHTACRFLTQHGYEVWNLSGGWNAYNMDV